MKNLLLLSLFSFIFLPNPSIGQTTLLHGKTAGVNIASQATSVAAISKDEITVDTLYLLLGTLSDYIGRTTTSPDQIDYYYPGEKVLYEYLINVLESSSDSPLTLEQKGEQRVNLHSAYWAKQIGEYYQEKESGNLRSTAQVSRQILKSPLAGDRTQKHSYLLGAVLRHGKKIASNIYQIRLSNSIYTEKQLLSLLHEMGCHQIYFQRQSNHIPVTSLLYFKAEGSLSNLLKVYDVLLSEIQTAKAEYYEEALGIELEDKISPEAAFLIEHWSTTGS